MSTTAWPLPISCLSVDLEVRPGDDTINALGGVRSDRSESVTFPGPTRTLPQALSALESLGLASMPCSDTTSSRSTFPTCEQRILDSASSGCPSLTPSAWLQLHDGLIFGSPAGTRTSSRCPPGTGIRRATRSGSCRKRWTSTTRRASTRCWSAPTTPREWTGHLVCLRTRRGRDRAGASHGQAQK